MARKQIQEENLEAMAWSGFTDILSSVILVLAFTVILAGMIIIISRITSGETKDNAKLSSSGKNEGGEGTETGTIAGMDINEQQSEIIAQFAREFQKLVIVGRPLSPQPTELVPTPNTRSEVRLKPQYNPRDAEIVSDFENVQRPGESRVENQGIRETQQQQPAYDVLEELVMRQQDVLAQQRKVIEKQVQDNIQLQKQYQSLLSIYTEMQREVEDVRQEAVTTDEQARFQTIPERNQLSGPAEISSGRSTYTLRPADAATKSVRVQQENEVVNLYFDDNASFLLAEKIAEIQPILSSLLPTYNQYGVTIRSKRSDYTTSGIESQRVALDRMLVIRSILIELGVDPTKIELLPIDERTRSEDKDYGWVNIAPKSASAGGS